MALLTDVLEWLQALPQPALVAATGGLVLAECTVGLGFIAPGEGGLLIAATTVDTPARFLVLWAVVTVCAGIGDSIGYGIGRRFGPRLRETKLIQKYGVDGWDKATGILRRRGAWAVFFARFLPVVRTLTPAAAGTSGLPYRKFLPAVVAGAACWSAVHIAIGAALGEAAKEIEKHMGRGGAFIVGGAVLIFVIVHILRKRKKNATAPATALAAESADPDEDLEPAR
ncbi:DedA family protein [Actinokineospora fastidiosa]|uniref:Membrane protein n=1 Tax=Actinokineospora fastidiosa TaxID=1816 RepID=A0A918LFM4_9PSEU|nr:DedA family protein [Actinokineospora fastidiosa]GGS40836.1 membrane protein [Actinokineospora fastidiosa]